ncbi:MAG: hypothetical protein OER43_03695 [Gammaproteobacteria bacterium]|nr:hypothetical protein [Gammaproteobacteria bacterium]MDH3410971.1 hypothetical protein [Gammaproteobacteria bacterium]
MLEFLGNAWTQLFMWTAAAGTIVYFSKLMKGAGNVWTLISWGVLLIGFRIGYKLLPFYKATEFTEALRYIIGIVGIVCLFIGIMRYSYITLTPLKK